jgi:hypothetical protein
MPAAAALVLFLMLDLTFCAAVLAVSGTDLHEVGIRADRHSRKPRRTTGAPWRRRARRSSSYSHLGMPIFRISDGPAKTTWAKS